MTEVRFITISVKYTVGVILSKYPPTLAGLKAAMPELRKHFPGTTRRLDVLTIPGVGQVDIRGPRGEKLQ